MKGFLQVASLFGIPLAIVIWYDMLTNTGGYLEYYTFAASRNVAVGIHVVLAFLCLHTPLHLWRNFTPMALREFCLTVALATFWVAVRLSSSGRIDQAVLFKSALVFLIPVAVYFALSAILFKLCRNEFDTERPPESNTQNDNDDDGSA